jgi:hypothetical protein
MFSDLTTEYKQFVYTFTPNANATNLEDCELRFDNNGTATSGTEAILYVKDIKLEKGNKVTDWTPAPEDVQDGIDAAQSTATSADSSADALNTRVTKAESSIEQLADSISTLVVDENGATMMQQTSTGCTFSMAKTQEALNAASKTANDANKAAGEAKSGVEELQKTAEKFEELNNYVSVETEGNQPVVELGNASDFKVKITNTAINFMDGENIPAYISNQKLEIGTANVNDELQFGGFAFAKRASGNMGIVWKGDD